MSDEPELLTGSEKVEHKRSQRERNKGGRAQRSLQVLADKHVRDRNRERMTSRHPLPLTTLPLPPPISPHSTPSQRPYPRPHAKPPCNAPPKIVTETLPFSGKKSQRKKRRKEEKKRKANNQHTKFRRRRYWESLHTHTSTSSRRQHWEQKPRRFFWILLFF